MNLLLLPLLPLLAAGLVSLPPLRRFAAPTTFAFALAAQVLALLATTAVLRQGSVVTLPNWIELDGLGALIAVLVAHVGTLAALYSWGYMARTSHYGARVWLYYLNFNLFLFSMLCVPVLAEPNLVWIAVESTTVLSVLLVSYENTREALEAAWKYVTLTLMGAAIALFGFLLLFWAAQDAGAAAYSWRGLVGAAPHMPLAIVRTAFVLVLVGFGAKVGLVPLHTWLPDAHSQAPSPVCAMLSGVETSAVLYAILRFLPILGAYPSAHAGTWAIVFGLVSTGTAAFLLLVVRDYKRLFAFSTVEHMGIVLFAAGLGTTAARYGAMAQVLAHSLTKSFCFYAAGAVLLVTGTREIAQVRGLFGRSAIAGGALLMGALAIGGAPLFAVFPAELAIIRAGLAQGAVLPVSLLVVFLALAFAAITFRVNRMVFEAPTTRSTPAGTPGATLPASVVIALVLAAVPVLLLGWFMPAALSQLLAAAAKQLGG